MPVLGMDGNFFPPLANGIDYGPFEIKLAAELVEVAHFKPGSMTNGTIQGFELSQ